MDNQPEKTKLVVVNKEFVYKEPILEFIAREIKDHKIIAPLFILFYIFVIGISLLGLYIFLDGLGLWKFLFG